MDDLYENTIRMIRDSGLPLIHIARGAGVKHRWICDLMIGRFTDPGIKKIQRVNNYLRRIKEKHAA